ncbi:hypothetical protein AMTR_s00081p00168810 [Amborella trichopoda]|uniref:Uncharacterized protein n=1 Tax=Amborella trichopoda TaxID=13333 RepID=W1PAB6_AMBTC|nr:hypothetical protein AMTR_s00081p00168810 [Amborella trichopoda]
MHDWLYKGTCLTICMRQSKVHLTVAYDAKSSQRQHARGTLGGENVPGRLHGETRSTARARQLVHDSTWLYSCSTGFTQRHAQQWHVMRDARQ